MTCTKRWVLIPGYPVVLPLPMAERQKRIDLQDYSLFLVIFQLLKPCHPDIG
jgi:hypothetical protein